MNAAQRARGSSINKEEEEEICWSQATLRAVRTYVRSIWTSPSWINRGYSEPRATSTVSRKGSIPRDSICGDVRVPRTGEIDDTCIAIFTLSLDHRHVPSTNRILMSHLPICPYVLYTSIYMSISIGSFCQPLLLSL